MKNRIKKRRKKNLYKKNRIIKWFLVWNLKIKNLLVKKRRRRMIQSKKGKVEGRRGGLMV
jgi:hypothetical protein